VVLTEDEVGEQRQGCPESLGVGDLEFGGDARGRPGGGGRKNQPMGMSKARAKATISSASNWRIRLPSTERSAAL
jgi:hypothetical protein